MKGQESWLPVMILLSLHYLATLGNIADGGNPGPTGSAAMFR